MENIISTFEQHVDCTFFGLEREDFTITFSDDIAANLALAFGGDTLHIEMKVKGWWSSTCITARIGFERFHEDRLGEMTVETFSCSSGGRDTDEVACDVEAMQLKADAITACAKVINTLKDNKAKVEGYMKYHFQAKKLKEKEKRAKRQAEKEQMQKEAATKHEQFCKENETHTEATAKKALTALSEHAKSQDKQEYDGSKIRKFTSKTIDLKSGELVETTYLIKVQCNRVSLHKPTASCRQLDKKNQISKIELSKQLQGCVIEEIGEADFKELKPTH